MAWKLAPSLRALLAEASRRWPDRSKASDGTIGDTAHSGRVSDHNPDARGIVHAIDLTHDPAHGVDCHVLFAQLQQRVISGAETRLKYAIWNRQIYNPTVWREPRRYTGTNPHSHHMHVSVLSTPSAENDVRVWFPVKPAPPPAPPKVEPEDRPQPAPIFLTLSEGVESVTHSQHFVGLPAALDQEGRGWVDIPHPMDRVFDVVGQGSNPPAEGYWSPLVVTRQPQGDKTRVSVFGSPGQHAGLYWKLAE